MIGRVPIYNDEKGRLAALYRYGILDTSVDEVFDQITAVASAVCETSIALISLIDVDRQWFKSTVGLDLLETPRDIAFCAHTIEKPTQMMEVEDATQDERFKDNPLVLGDPKIRSYAGQALVTPDGYAIGTLCVIGLTPKSLIPSQRVALGCLARLVMTLLENRISSPTAIIYQAIQQKVPAGIVISDQTLPDQPVMFCNNGFEQLTGYSPEEIIGKNCRILQGEETCTKTITEIRDAIANQESANFELMNYRKDGSEFWNELILTPVLDYAGNLTHSVGVMNDITRRVAIQIALQESNENLQESLQMHADASRKLAESNVALQNEMKQRLNSELQSRRLQEELAHIGRLSTMGEMATGLAHELNQPLLAVSQSADTALLIAGDIPDSDPDLLECLRDIQSESQRAGQIIRALRQFITRNESNRETVDLSQIVDQTVSLIQSDARLHNIAIEVAAEEVPAVLVDRIQIAQVLVNLLRNSVDAMSAVSNVSPKILARVITVAIVRVVNDVMVSVTDTGPGFDSNIEPFKAYETSKENGLGIGLSISRSIIESHNGKMWLDKSITTGCRIGFTLPISTL